MASKNGISRRDFVKNASGLLIGFSLADSAIAPELLAVPQGAATAPKTTPLDAWLRVHVRLGGKIIKTCHESKIVRGTRAEWEQWTALKFPQSGKYMIPGALNSIEMNIEKDEGIYVEPNVWMAHVIS